MHEYNSLLKILSSLGLARFENRKKILQRTEQELRITSKAVSASAIVAEV